MDEPWRMRNGLNLNLPRRRSTEETSSDLIGRDFFASQTTLQPEDFHDVFGGPPRTLVYRKLSADFPLANGAGSSAFYEDIFRSSDSGETTKRGRNLPVFRIPAETVHTGETVRGRDLRRTEGFYIDIFGAAHQEYQKWRSKSKSKSRSKSTTSSVLSSEDRSPLRPSAPEDPFFSSFSSRLRPINVPHRPNRSPSMPTSKHKMRGSPEFPWNHPRSRECHFTENEHYYKNNHFWFPRSGSSPETISLEPSSYQSLKVSPEDQETESPTSSVLSSLCQESDNKVKFLDKAISDEQEQEVMGSFVIELTSDKREVRDESVAIDEAIAWAKEKFQSKSLEATEILKQQQQIVKPSVAAEPFEYSEDLSARSISHQLSNGRGDTSMVDDLNSLWSQKP